MLVETEADGPAVAGSAKSPEQVTARDAGQVNDASPGGRTPTIPGTVTVGATTTVPGAAGATATNAAKGGSSLGSLSRIRQQFADRQANADGNQSKPLEMETLHQAWQQYADYLRENRNPAVQSLELATLRIIDANNFEAITSNNLEQKFIEQEKRGLSDHLQKAFANKTVSFSVLVEERAQVDEEPTERPLNKREQFIQIIEQYPLVKELKDRLRLELDY